MEKNCLSLYHQGWIVNYFTWNVIDYINSFCHTTINDVVFLAENKSKIVKYHVFFTWVHLLSKFCWHFLHLSTEMLFVFHISFSLNVCNSVYMPILTIGLYCIRRDGKINIFIVKGQVSCLHSVHGSDRYTIIYKHG